MKAIVQRGYGSVEQLELVELARPVPKPGEVLVRVRAASLNSWDRDNLLGKFPNRTELGLRAPKYSSPGGDIAGTVEAVPGPGSRFAPGDDVFGDLSRAGWGAFAQYVRVPESALTRKPPGLGFEQAAALPQAGVMALQGIVDYGATRAGQRVLINGAGGGAGSFAVQLAKSRGAEVTAVDSAAKLAMLRSIGADHVLDYRQTDYTATGERYDVILDCEVHRSVRDCRRALAPQGVFIMMGGDLSAIPPLLLLGRWLAIRSTQRMSLLLHEANKNLAALGELAEAGTIKPVIDAVWPLHELPQAMARLCEGSVIGKAVINLD